MAERLAHSDADFELHYCARSSERAFVERIRHRVRRPRVRTF
jgi:vanillate O-demethylase ferredoxin subunit